MQIQKLIIYLTCMNTLKFASLQNLALPVSLRPFDDNDDRSKWTDWIPFIPPLDNASGFDRHGFKRFFRRYLRPDRINRRRNLPIFQAPENLSSLSFRLLKFTNDARMGQGLLPLCLNL